MNTKIRPTHMLRPTRSCLSTRCIQIYCLPGPQASAAHLKFSSAASPGLSELVHPGDSCTIAAPGVRHRKPPPTYTHPHTLSSESSPYLIETQCEHWGTELSSVLFCPSINHGRGLVLCSQRPQWEMSLKIQSKDSALQRNHTTEL